MPDATARIDLLPSNQGGRKTAMASGWRSLLRVVGTTQDVGVQVEFEGENVRPGDGREVALSFWAREVLPQLEPGARFELREGARIIGTGQMLSTAG